MAAGGSQPHAWLLLPDTGPVQVRNRGKALADRGLAVEALQLLASFSGVSPTCLWFECDRPLITTQPRRSASSSEFDSQPRIPFEMSDGGGDGGGGGVTISASGVLSGLFPKLVVCTIATSCVLGFVHPVWKVVQDVPALQEPPYNPNIALAMKYSFIVVSTAASTFELQHPRPD